MTLHGPNRDGSKPLTVCEVVNRFGRPNFLGFLTQLQRSDLGRDPPRFGFLLPVQVVYLTSPATAISTVSACWAEVSPFRFSWNPKVYLMKTLNHQVRQVDRKLFRLRSVLLLST
ncbi:unnamed protein product [Arabidopsis lyrata]|uniref:Expressed protein n=1 Tax=Arabidopsis lyrata subsp. lyrata TaxID=81972 RepID=D7LY60_ARALL|nr:expressed protein [Arabidopsis lyrata subsp. lyrata]CAH8270060.1 unnamed protein product [Arabidopsis lyrata]